MPKSRSSPKEVLSPNVVKTYWPSLLVLKTAIERITDFGVSVRQYFGGSMSYEIMS